MIGHVYTEKGDSVMVIILSFYSTALLKTIQASNTT